MLALIGLFVGAIVGNLLWRDWGAALGGIAGFLIGATLVARRKAIAPDAAKTAARPAVMARASSALPAPGTDARLGERIGALERRVAELERMLAPPQTTRGTAATSGAVTAAEAAAQAAPAPATMAAEASDDTVRMPALHARHPSVSTIAPDGTMTMPTAEAAGERETGAGEQESVVAAGASPGAAPGAAAGSAAAADTFASSSSADGGRPAFPSRVNPLWAWFTGGNALTRIGVVVLLIGVAFLLRYFAEHFTLPIELRLAAVALGGFVLIAIGMRMGATRRGYGLSLQGAGGGVLYLTTYAAFRLYGVLPEIAAVASLVAVSALTVWLAWRRDSQPLAALAIVGGFLAPMLIASGGEPLPLFTYFALLNGAIFALAWTKAWRALNTLGFVFTFGGGVLWGHELYRPEHFRVVEPFLILFFAFYVTIAILYARRGSFVAKSPVDGLLVFGVPLATFVLQQSLLADTRYGAAWSAVALAGIYALLFAATRRRTEPGFALLARAFLALAVIFATIAVPFAVDDRATAALWALEATGAYWIGLRQDQRLVRAFALLVEVGAGVVFIHSGADGSDDLLFANAFFAGALMIAAAALVTARLGDRAAPALPSTERAVVPFVFAWGVLWWLAAGGVELARQLPDDEQLHAVLAWVTASVAAALVVARPAAWPRLSAAGVALLPAMVAVAIGDFDRERTTLDVYGWVVWPLAWIVHWCALRAADALSTAETVPDAKSSERAAWMWRLHAVSALTLVVQLAWEASERAGRVTPIYTSWIACAAALPPIVYLVLCTVLRHSARWPAVPYGRAYAIGAGIPVATLLVVWFFAVNVLSPGDPSPLPYWPIASPLDLTLALVLWALARWGFAFDVVAAATLVRWIGAGVFVALNGVVMRTAHHWADIPWRLSPLLASKPLQAALTLTWTATALALMVLATRRGMRALWMTGAALLALVVVKLFLVDLAALSGLPRVIAFLGVGVLLLAIGFLSPLPPAAPGVTEKRR